MRSLCYENQFSFILKVELITITKISHLDSLWKRDLGELGNGLFNPSKFIQFNSIRQNIHLILGTGSSNRIRKIRAWERIIANTIWRTRKVLTFGLSFRQKRNIFTKMMRAKELSKRMWKLLIRVSGCLGFFFNFFLHLFILHLNCIARFEDENAIV